MKDPTKCDWCKKPLGRTWVERSGLYFCYQEYAPAGGRCTTHIYEIIDRWREIVAKRRCPECSIGYDYCMCQLP